MAKPTKSRTYQENCLAQVTIVVAEVMGVEDEEYAGYCVYLL